jgi:carboxylesterase
MMGELVPTAEPFFFPGGPVGCLLIHGFTGTPKEMRGLGGHLARQGYSVLGPRLSGHATRPEDMNRSHWQDWVASAEDGWHLLSAACKRIYILGLSMGGVLTGILASRFPTAGIVMMATPHHLPDDLRLRILPVYSRVKPLAPKGQSHWFDRQAESESASYTVEPVRAFGELAKLIRQMQAALPHVQAPALLIYAKRDPVIRAVDHHAEDILVSLGSCRKEIQWVDPSGHVLTSDISRQKVFDLAADFIDRSERGLD